MAQVAVEDEGPGCRRDIFDRFSEWGRRRASTDPDRAQVIAEHVDPWGDHLVEDRLDGTAGARFVVQLPLGDLDMTTRAVVMRPIRHLVAAMALAVGIGACSLPTDDEAALIDTSALPEVLRGDAQVTTTIDPGPLTEPVEIFLLRNDGDRTVVVPVARELDPFAGFEQEIGLLFRGQVSGHPNRRRG